MFCETIDNIFDEYFERNGLSDDMISMKETILRAFLEENNKCHMSYKNFKPMNFAIHSNGDVDVI